MRKSPWLTHSSQYSFENPWFKVKTSQVTTPGGRPGTYGVIEIPPAVVIVALNEQQEFCLIQEYRYPTQQWMWELPIGGVSATDLSPLQAAQRELLEETGLVSNHWESISSLHGIKGLTNHVLHVYLAHEVTQQSSSIEHDEAIVGKRFIAVKEFFEEVRQGAITDEETIAPVAAVVAYLGLI